MRQILDMDNIQIEVTNSCIRSCSNCTRFCGHHYKPYFMDLEQVRGAIDSMAGYPKMTGIMGGEPLLHPLFPEICSIAAAKIPREQLGLWTSLPEGKEHYAQLICDTFGQVFLNDHTRGDIYHAPILIGMKELVVDMKMAWREIDKCWLQNCWSASINPYGAYFCEVAAALALLFQDPEGAWPIEDGWWWRVPKDFAAQAEKWCPLCGIAAPLKRRLSGDGRDDISPANASSLKGKSKKVDQSKTVIGLGCLTEKPEEMASYKDLSYRQGIAAKYGMHLKLTEKGYCEPLMGFPKPSLFSQYEEELKNGHLIEAVGS
jgi:hypothetical protein